MPVVSYPHIEIGTDRVARIEGSRIKVVMLIEAHLVKGGGAEEIQKYYPMVTLAEIYGALTYYYDNKSEVDSEIDRRRLVQANMDELFANSPTMQRLRAMKSSLHVDKP